MDGADVLRGDVVLVPFPYVTDLIAARKLSPVELVEALIRRVELCDIQTRAFITRTFDLARQKARQAEAEIAAGHPCGLYRYYESPALRCRHLMDIVPA